MDLHIGYCEGFGISKEEMERTEEKEGKQTPFVARGAAGEITNTTQLAPHTQGTLPLNAMDYPPLTDEKIRA
jgi:hypothetical protein